MRSTPWEETGAELDAGMSQEEIDAERAAARAALARLHRPADRADGDTGPDTGPVVCEWCGQRFPCPDSPEGGAV